MVNIPRNAHYEVGVFCDEQTGHEGSGEDQIYE